MAKAPEYCADDYNKHYGFEPDMGDGIDFHPGTCDDCHEQIIVFVGTEE